MLQPGDFFSIDIETLGLDIYAPIIEIGARKANWISGEQSGNYFHCYVRPEQGVNSYDNCEPYAMAMHSRILKRIAELEAPYFYCHQEDVAIDFHQWLQQHGYEDSEKITCAGKNFASFDAPRLRRLDSWDHLIKMHHRCLDPGNLFWEPEIDTVELPDSKTCMQRAGLVGEVAHTAMEDADMVVKMVFDYVARRRAMQS